MMSLHNECGYVTQTEVDKIWQWLFYVFGERQKRDDRVDLVKIQNYKAILCNLLR